MCALRGDWVAALPRLALTQMKTDLFPRSYSLGLLGIVDGQARSLFVLLIANCISFISRRSKCQSAICFRCRATAKAELVGLYVIRKDLTD